MFELKCCLFARVFGCEGCVFWVVISLFGILDVSYC